jgi:hypothetical protein
MDVGFDISSLQAWVDPSEMAALHEKVSTLRYTVISAKQLHIFPVFLLYFKPYEEHNILTNVFNCVC